MTFHISINNCDLKNIYLCVEAKAPAGKECIWSNSTALRVALLAWGGRCAVARFSFALRPASGGAWTDIPTDGEIAEVIL